MLLAGLSNFSIISPCVRQSHWKIVKITCVNYRTDNVFNLHAYNVCNKYFRPKFFIRVKLLQKQISRRFNIYIARACDNHSACSVWNPIWTENYSSAPGSRRHFPLFFPTRFVLNLSSHTGYTVRVSCIIYHFLPFFLILLHYT